MSGGGGAEEPPLVTPELSKRDTAVLRRNIERFVDGLVSEPPYALAALLNASFTFDMLDLLFKRMTAKLRALLFSPARTVELLGLAMNAGLPTHTRALATSFVVLGNAATTGMAPCTADTHTCDAVWDRIFGALHTEAQGQQQEQQRQEHGEARAVPLRQEHRLSQGRSQAAGESTGMNACSKGKAAAELQDLEQVLRDEVKDIERDGALERQASLLLQVAERAKRHADFDDSRSDGASSSSAAASPRSAPLSPNSQSWTPRSSVSAHVSMGDIEAELESLASETVNGNGNGNGNGYTQFTPLPSPGSLRITTNISQEAIGPFPTACAPVSPICGGLYGADSANFSSQLLRYFAVCRQKGACILRYLAAHPPTVDLLVANIGQDSTRILLLHLIYADHSEVALRALFRTHLIDKTIQRLVTSRPPRDAYARDCIENAFLLLREIVHAPYLTPRGVAISAKIVPFDNLGGAQDGYVSICGTARDATQVTFRKYTSRKVRHIVHLFMAQNQLRLEKLFSQMIKELTFWSTPTKGLSERRGSALQMQSIESLSLLDAGHPRAACTTMLMHLFELTETVELSESPSSKDVAAPTVGIDCLNFTCATHLVLSGRVQWKRAGIHQPQSCHLGVNCIQGLRVSVENAREGASPIMSATLEEIVSVERNSWHPHGFCVEITTTVPSNPSIHSSKSRSDSPHKPETRIEYFAAESGEALDKWISLMEQVICGDLVELETYCSDDWRSHAREYRRLRECLIVSMERRGFELFSFLKQVVVLNTRRASTYHLVTIVKFLYAVLSNESKRIDQLFVSAQLMAVLLTCFEKYPNQSLLLSEITRIVTFALSDFKSKRSAHCPLISRLFLSEGPHARLCPLLTRTFVGTNGGRDSRLAGTDALAHLQVIMEAIRVCYREPNTSSQVRVQELIQQDEKWEMVLHAFEEAEAKSPERSITSKPRQPSISQGNVTPSQPAFQEHIFNQLTRPTYAMMNGLGSSFLQGDGCAYGFLLKQRDDGTWQRVLLVLEYSSYRLWYYHPTGHDEAANVPWQWVIPREVHTRFTKGKDSVTHSCIGHHGLFVDAYDPSLVSDNNKLKKVTRELHFSVNKLEDREQWLEVLSSTATKITQLTNKFAAMWTRLHNTNRKTLVQCANPQCQEKFKVYRHPHSCKRCGQWFCSKCASQRLTMPEVGRLTPVRHCQSCYEANCNDSITDTRPIRLLGSISRAGSRRGSVTSEHDENGRLTYCNPELNELARGMVSSRTLLQLRRRMNRSNSIESPTAKLQIDEVDSFFFAEDYDVEVDPFSPPGSPTYGKIQDMLDDESSD